MLPVTFMSDYGLRDEYVGVCHGVIRRVAPDVPIIDISHGVPARDIRAGALTLRRALPFMPTNAVHLAVVDPGVGTERRPIALRCENDALLVGPDNGLLWPAAQDSGGVVAAADLTNSPHLPEHVSATFHGRDLFAPIVGQLATHLPLERIGEQIDPATLVELDLPRPQVGPGSIGAQVISVDGFGNLTLNAGPAELEQAGLQDEAKLHMRASAGERQIALGRTFADVPADQPIIFRDSTGALAIAINGGSAASVLGLESGSELTLDRSE